MHCLIAQRKKPVRLENPKVRVPPPHRNQIPGNWEFGSMLRREARNLALKVVTKG
jgi:hypothetical protein